jgi:hypothetical protein
MDHLLRGRSYRQTLVDQLKAVHCSLVPLQLSLRAFISISWLQIQFVNITKVQKTADFQYTSPAYSARTSRTCHPLSFSDLADGQLPSQSDSEDVIIYDLIICSFALHLLTEPSELFALLYELSTKCRWLAVIAPHKKPEIKDGWGWERWDLKNWNRAGEAVYAGGRGGDDEVESELEIVRDK